MKLFSAEEVGAIVKEQVEAAVLAERERIAAHFDAMPGREMFGGTIADEIRGMK